MPWEFWRLTPREFRLRLDGFFRREDRSWQKVAVLGGWILSPYTPKNKQHQLRTDTLLGRSLTVFPIVVRDIQD